MREYQIFFKNGKTQDFSCEGKKDLIEKLFEGDEDKLIAEVKLLKWESGAMFYSEDPSEAKVNSQITTADTNPYQWRNQADEDSDKKAEDT
jgi:hypothetical protein